MPPRPRRRPACRQPSWSRQAALETGWGRSEPRQADGQPSYNVFGIKAGRNWTGPTVDATTTEYVNGVAQQRVERFRAYGSYAEAFGDYAKLLGSSPRYSGVVGATDATTFARGLQRAGYATDPAYADKLTRIIGGQTLRAALARLIPPSWHKRCSNSGRTSTVGNFCR